MKFSEVREKFPDYDDLSDQQLADAIHRKFYSDLDKDLFYKEIGFSPAQQKTLPQDNDAKERTALDEGIRKAGLASKGFSDSVLEAVGALPDLVGSGLRAIGAPAPADPNFYTDQLKKGYQGVGSLLASLTGLDRVVNAGGVEPESRADKIALGAGRGAGAATTFLAPAAALGNLAKAGSVTQRAARAAAQQPKTQVAAGLLGGATTGATDSELAGFVTSLLAPVPVAAARKVGQTITQPFKRVEGEKGRLVDRAEDLSVPLTPAQITDSPTMKRVEGALANFPFTSAAQKEIIDNQRKILNNRILQTAGIQADEASPEVLSKGFEDLGERFQSLIKQTNIKVPPTWFDKVDKIAERLKDNLTVDQSKKFATATKSIKEARDFLLKKEYDRVPGENVWRRQAVEKQLKIDGDAYRKITSEIAERARTNNDPDVAFALRELNRSINELLEQSVGKDVKNKWADARRKYRNLMTITDAMIKAPQADTVSGNIPIGQLTASVRKRDPKGFALGRGDLNDLTRISNLLGAAKPPDPGTAAMGATMSMLSGLFAFPTLGLSLAGPIAAQQVVNRLPRSYLRPSAARQQSPIGLLQPSVMAGAAQFGDDDVGEIQSLLGP